MRGWIVLVVLAAGCATVDIPSPAQLSATLNSRYAGQPVNAVIARFGMPHSQFIAGTGVRVLEWHTTNSMRFHEPVTTTTTGVVGDPGAYPFLASVPYRETTTTSRGYDVDYACTMQVGVRKDATVEAIGFQGQMGACQNFAP